MEFDRAGGFEGEEAYAIIGVEPINQVATEGGQELVFLRHALARSESALQDAVTLALERTRSLEAVAHDLRSPLMTIIAAGTLLARAADSFGVRRMVASLIRAAETMERLVDDLQDAARLQTGHVPMEVESVDLEFLASETAEMLRPLAARTGARIELAAASGAPVHARCDRHQMARVLTNLLANAIRFTPRGAAVRVSATAVDDEARISVVDRGPGIATEDLANVFQPYWRAESADSANRGLGLAIARSIVIAHGGRIWAESTVNVGSTFVVSLPKQSARHPAPSLFPA